jgi:RNA polymerase sigma-70 factor, ECF subfamily
VRKRRGLSSPTIVRLSLRSLFASSSPDAALVDALRNGDEAAYTELVERLGPSMLRLARVYVSSMAVAEEVVQEAWLAVLTGVDRFEGRSSLKTWVFRIVANKAKTRAEREGRTVPFSSLGDAEPAVDPDRFVDTGEPGKGPWATPPMSLDRVPEDRLLAREARERIVAAIVALPPAQRVVITLRDVDGLTAEEACEVLGVSDGNQRVLLHRARSKVRAEFERYIEGRAPSGGPHEGEIK